MNNIGWAIIMFLCWFIQHENLTGRILELFRLEDE